MKFIIEIASEKHSIYEEDICKAREETAKYYGIGISKKKSDFVKSKLSDGNAIIATDEDGNFAGFQYIKPWEQERFVFNSRLFLNPKYRETDLAQQIHKKIFELSRTKYPNAKVFVVTALIEEIKTNLAAGFKPTAFSELIDDKEWWNGCQECANYDVLTRNNRQRCLCTGMLYDSNNGILKK